MDLIEAQIVPAHASGQVKRGGRRFALIAAAGEMATAAGLTGWPEGEAIRAAHTCFNAWLTLRGGAGSSEKTNMLRQVRAFLEANGEGRFTYWHRASDDRVAKTLNKAGVRRMLDSEGNAIKSNSQHTAEYGEVMHPLDGESVSFEYFVLGETFKSEVCKGYDVQAVCAVLVENACLTVKEPGRYSIKTTLPGIGPSRCYCIPPSIFGLDL
jgi:putative DNA primase/helicase